MDATRTKAPPPFRTLAAIGCALALFSNAYSLFSVVPYAGFMVQWVGVAKTTDDAGYYAGFLVAAYMIGRASTSILWGGLSDRIGRKPVLLIGCASMIIGQLMFGLSRSFAVALLARLLMGAFNGVVGTGKTVASELSPPHAAGQQQRAMSLLSAGVSLASLIGPGVGGALADPSKQYKGVFAELAFFNAFPYALPNLVGVGLSSLTAVWIVAFVPETLPDAPTLRCCAACACVRVRDAPGAALVARDESADICHISDDGEVVIELADLPRDDAAHGRSDTSSAASSCASASASVRADRPAPTRSVRTTFCAAIRGCAGEVLSTSALLLDRRVGVAIGSYTFVSFADMYFGEVTPLWLIASPGVGGLGWSPALIGAVAVVCGAFVLAYQLILFPLIVKPFGPKALLVLCAALTAPVVLTLPFLSLLEHALSDAMLMVLVSLWRTFQSIAKMSSFTCTFLLINNSIGASRRGELIFFTVTFCANPAHNLTRSP